MNCGGDSVTGMRTVLLVLLLGLAVWLTFFPMVDATKRGRSSWPWIIGGILAGPLSGIAYLASRGALVATSQRHGEPLR